MAEEDPGELVGRLAESYVDSRCIHVIASLGVADAVGDAPRAFDDIAAEVGADPGALLRVMRHVASLGVFTPTDGTFVHNEASRVLRSDHPDDLLTVVRLLGLPICWDSTSGLEHAVRTGRPGTDRLHPEGFFGYLANHPEESESYDAGMQAMTVWRLPAIVPKYDFSPFGVIADIGGGRGHLLRAILEQTPTAAGILFDQAHVVAQTPADDRITVHPGSFFTDPLPSADCYLLSRVLHDWSDAECATILRAVRAAAPESSRLLLFEYLVEEEDGLFEASDIDVMMLTLVTGRERSQREYEELLADGGFELVRVVPTEHQSILEARPV